MPVTNATILIPDISGFTQFMTVTELEHGSHLISDFLETIIQNVDGSFEISEIEGDAVLLYKKDTVPSKQEILDLCLKMFEAFHYKRKFIQKVAVCPCGACQALINLSLKFITHYGSLLEIKVNRFTKASGLDMIIAHRILKNSVPSNEYILFTENFLKQVGKDTDPHGLSWQSSADEFPFIGKVNYEFALLEPIRNRIPDPPVPEVEYQADDSPYIELEIKAKPDEIFMAMLDMPKRVYWMNDLKQVEGESEHVYIGSVHYLVFNDVRGRLSPIKMVINDNEIFYSEIVKVEELDISVVYEFRFSRTDEGNCLIATRILPGPDKQISTELFLFLQDSLKISIANLKAFVENGRHPEKSEVISDNHLD
jgi:Protein of unknown function (DUF2652)